MQNTVNVRFQQAYKAEADWKSSDPVGKKGEIMISSDKNGMFKVGNGTSKWSELNYNNAGYASSAGSVAWGNVSGKPSSMPASDVYAWAKASSKPSYGWSEITGKPSTFTPASHTHTTSQITDFPESLKNPANITISLNGGSTEGTNLFTYDGSTPKTLNITPAIIGAAYSSHTHTKSQITDFPSTMANPHSITIKLNGGSSEGSNLFTYNGSSAKSLNITASSIGAATSGHTHSQYYDSGQSRTANTVLAAPNGSDGNATFRKLVASDIPSLNYFPSTGGILYGALETGSDIKCKTLTVTDRIEIYNSYTPYIDFHYSNSTADYTSRIIENTSGVLNINGATFTNGGAIWSKWITVDGSISVTQAGNFGSGVACANESRFYVNSYTDPMPGVTCAIKATGIIAASALYATGSGSNVEAQVHAKNDSRDAYLCASSSGRAGIYDTKHGWIIFNDNDCRTTYIQECKVYNGKVIAKADSTSWLVGASPGGASFESINITDGALVPIWRCRTADGAWVGASYASDPGFRIYYANNARLKAQTDNGTDARFTFGASGIMYATSFSNTSDERKKDVIDFLSGTLPSSYKNFFMKLRPFTFKWNDNLLDKKSHYGVGAQSVYQAALDCGFTDDDLGFIHKGKELPGTSIPWSVSYTEFIPLNIAVTQDHETRIEKLERENEELKQQIKELKGLTA